jgi:hypothetical protein
MERLLTTSKELADKINSNDNAANELLHQCEVLQQKFKAMIQVLMIRNSRNIDVCYFILFISLSIRVLFKRSVEVKITPGGPLGLNLVTYDSSNRIIQS